MTGTLKDLMTQRADAEPAPHVDLDAIVRAGDARLRRRRAVAGAGAAALAAVLAVGVPAVVDDDSSKPSGVVRPAGGAYVDRQVTYALESAIHNGDQVIDVSPQKVTTYVQTDDGFVFADGSGAIFFADGDETVRVGRTGLPYGQLLVADDSGPYAGWVDTESGPASEFVVYDTSSRTEVVRTSEGNVPTTDSTGEFDLPMMGAIDGEFAYWHSSAGITRWDLRTDSAELIAPRASYTWLQDVAADQVARTAHETQRTVVNADPDADAPLFDGTFANLSPRARYVYTDVDDRAKVFDVATGDERTPDFSGYPFMALSQWLDDDRLVAVAIRAGNKESDPLDLLTCSIASGDCEVTVSEAGPVNELALPIGERLGD